MELLHLVAFPLLRLSIPFLVFSIAAGRIIYALWLSPYSHVPGPRLCKITGFWIIYHDMMLQRNQKIYQWHEKYGSIVLIAPGQVSVSTANVTRQIYTSSGYHPKSAYFNNFIMYGERPIFSTLDCREHRRLRKRTFSFYQPTSIYKPAVLEPIRHQMLLFLRQLETDAQAQETLDILPRCNMYSFDNITRLIYGPHHCARTVEPTQQERIILDGWKECEVWNNFQYNFPHIYRLVKLAICQASRNPNFLTAEERLSEWNMAKLTSSLEKPDTIVAGTLMGQLYEARTEHGEPLPFSWMGAELLDNIQAAQTTVALALTYALWDLACHPQWQHQIRQELLTKPLCDDGFPSFADINSAEVLDACIRESSRLNPLSSGRAERVVPETKIYDNVVIPAGTIISTSTAAIHRSPDAFAEPHEYRPDRWLQADTAQLRAMESCYMPFGYGARLCLGKAFALAEIKIMMACLLLRFQLSEDAQSLTNAQTMTQLGTQNALPRGLRCDIKIRSLDVN
ncbi:uncharacterized protein G6M90_00g081010 [Metarhizium brunneum]|uniref:Cytochrome P450 n=1 Tax=Metarhizium brunneum TaxID=500148 RepID=A0A7D5Z893_9HYPO